MKYFIRKKIINETRGSALIFALLMTTVLAVICAVVIRMEFFRLAFISKNIHKRKAVYYTEAGIYKTLWYLSGHDGITKEWRPVEEPVEVFDDNRCYVTVKEWGVYLAITSRITYKGISDSLQVIAAEIPSSVYSQAVVVGDSEFPLVVTGRNKIIGDIEVSKEGVKTGKISGKGFEGKTPVQGKIRGRENPQMPFFDTSIFKKVFIRYKNILQYRENCSYFFNDLHITDEIITECESRNIYIDGHIFITDSLLSNPLRGPLRIISTGSIFITDSISIREHVEFISAENIYIKNKVSIEQGIIFAEKKVEISGQSRINAQIFSREEIYIKNQAVVKYPSVLYSSGTVEDNTLIGKIIIGDNSKVIGTIILSPLERDMSVHKDETIIYITEGAAVAGVVYSHHFVELRGCVYGTVVTSSFYLYLPPTSYLNWLKDSVIDRSQLPDNFLMPLSFRTDPEYEVLLWEG